MTSLKGAEEWPARPAATGLMRPWPFAAAAATAALLALCAVFNREVVVAVRVWLSSHTYNHCFLIVPIALYMIYERRDCLRAIVPLSDYRALIAVIILSLMWIPVSVLGVLEARQFLLITIMQAVLLSVLGWPAYRKLLAPFLYLYFLVPTGSLLTAPLQDFTARFAVEGLQILGIPVYADGTIIEVPAGRFAVAEACAGLRFLIATVALGVFYATEFYESWLRRIVFVALCFVVPVVANGFRALGIIWAAQTFSSVAAVEADHVIYGWVFFTFVLMMLILGGQPFADRVPSVARGPHHSPPLVGRNAIRRFFTGAILAALASAVGPLIAISLDKPQSIAPPATPPQSAGSWVPVTATANWKPIVIAADREFSDAFVHGNSTLYRFVALYRWYGGSSNLIHSENRIADTKVWRTAASGRISIPVHGTPMTVMQYILVSGSRHLLVWSFYVVDGSTKGSLWSAKFGQIHAYLSGMRCPSAFIAIATDQDVSPDTAEAALTSYLNAMEAPQQYVCPADYPPAHH